jgi:hypothetical protein
VLRGVVSATASASTVAGLHRDRGRHANPGGDVSHAQPGDPAKAAAAILRITSEPNPPLRVQLGQDPIDAVKAKLERAQQRWNPVRSRPSIRPAEASTRGPWQTDPISLPVAAYSRPEY